MDASEPPVEGPADEPVGQPTEGSSGSGSGLRAPQGCGEWTVVILGVIWIVLAILFVIALILRLNGSL